MKHLPNRNQSICSASCYRKREQIPRTILRRVTQLFAFRFYIELINGAHSAGESQGHDTILTAQHLSLSASPGTQVLIGAIRSFPAGSMSAQISDCFPDARQLICDSTLIGY